jgi:hypothetical protein
MADEKSYTEKQLKAIEYINSILENEELSVDDIGGGGVKNPKTP